MIPNLSSKSSSTSFTCNHSNQESMHRINTRISLCYPKSKWDRAHYQKLSSQPNNQLKNSYPNWAAANINSSSNNSTEKEPQHVVIELQMLCRTLSIHQERFNFLQCCEHSSKNVKFERESENLGPCLTTSDCDFGDISEVFGEAHWAGLRGPARLFFCFYSAIGLGLFGICHD